MTDPDDTVHLPQPPKAAAAHSDEFVSISDGALHGMLEAGRGGLREWSPPPIEELQKSLPQYEVQAFVARGGMGAVYRGVHRALEREVAIKIMPPNIEEDELQFAERFKAEAKAMARLEHPNIVAVHDAGETPDGLLYFVMEFVRGTDVQEIIAREGKVEPRRALEITCAVLDALGFAHEGGIIHRDIKPSNVMFDTKGRVKVADFGLAKALNSESAGFTGSEVMLGTADFIAPEAAIKGIKLDARADIYAVGVMLYVMLTGKIPRGRFEMPTAVLPKIDPRLDAIVDKAMQTERDRRFASAAEMKAAVEKVIADTCTGAMPKPGSPAAKPKSARVPMVVSAVAIIAAASFFVFKKPASVVKPEVASPPAAKPVEASKETWTDAMPELLKTNSNKSQQTPEGLRIAGGAGFGPVLRDAALRVTLPRIESTVGVSVRSTGKKVGDKFEQYTAHFFMPGSVGLTRYGLKDAPDVQFAVVPLPGFDPRTKHTLELRAVGDRLTVLVDGKVQIEQRDANFREGKFGITGYDNVFEKIEYARLVGTTAGPAASKPPETKPAPAPQGKWVDRIDEWFNKPDANVSRLSRMPDGARVEAAGAIPLYMNPARDAAVRLTLRECTQAFTLLLRIGKGGGATQERYGAGYAPGGLALYRFRLDTVQPDKLAQALLPASFDPEAKHTFEFRAVGDLLTVFLDGKQVIEQHDSAYTEGKSNITLPVGSIIEKLEYLILDAPGVAASKTAEAPKENWIDLIAETLERSERSKLTQLPEGTRIDGSFGFGAGKTPRDSVVRAVVLDAAQGFSVNLRSNGKIGNKWKQYHFYLKATGELLLYMEDADKYELARKALANFDPKAKHIFEFRAVGDRLTTSLDGRQIINAHDATYPAGSFAFSAEGTVFEKIEYAILDKPVTTSAAAPVPVAPAEKWTNALADWIAAGGPGDDFVPQNDGTALGTGRFPSRLLALPPNVPPPQDQAVRATFTLGRATRAFVEVRRGYTLLLQREGAVVRLGTQDQNGRMDELKSWPLPAAFNFATAHSLELRAIGDELTASLDANKLGSLKDAQLSAGSPCAGGEDGVVISKLDYLLLDK